jgi:hypothetical protein
MRWLRALLYEALASGDDSPRAGFFASIVEGADTLPSSFSEFGYGQMFTVFSRREKIS